MKRICTLALAILLLLSFTVFAGGQKETGKEEGTAVRTGKYAEAPALAAMVAAGELPAVDERLPKEPLVLQMNEKIGTYGGDIHRVWLGSADSAAYTLMTYDPLVRWNQECSKIVPNIATNWDVSSDGKVFTFHLREGIKWSDGVEFTADDIMCWYAIMKNDELTPSKPDWFSEKGKLAKCEKLDKYTVRFTLTTPYALFVEKLAVGGWAHMLPANCPQHYLKDFMPPWTPLADVQKTAKDAGYDNWTDYFAFIASMLHPDVPVVKAWKIISEAGGQRLTAERNPYYWKVDPDGKQLPYIARLIYDFVESRDISSAKQAAGELDVAERHMSPNDRAIFNESLENGKLKLIQGVAFPEGASWTSLNVNQNYIGPEKEIWADILRNVKFRQAISLGINRADIAKVLNPVSRSSQTTLNPVSPYYKEEWATPYTEYDPEGAKKLLDELGLKMKGKWRATADGKPLNLVLSPRGTSGGRVDCGEMVAEDLKKIGINVIFKPEEGSLWGQKRSDGTHMISVYAVTGAWEPLLGIHWWVPVRAGNAFAPLNAKWYGSGGKEGVKATGDIAKLYPLYEEAVKTVDFEARKKLIQQMFDLHAKNLWYIGILTYPEAVPGTGWGVRPNMMNVVPYLCFNHAGGIGIQTPEQWFYEN